MTSVLLTGAAGLIGSHLAEAAVADGDDVVATYKWPTIRFADIEGKLPLRELDVTDFPAVTEIIAETKPVIIYHLAAQSLPTVSWVDPWTTLNTNVIGTVNVFEAIKAVRKAEADYDPCVVVACSSAEYGASLTPERVPVTEEAPLLPMHPYGVSKVAQDLLAAQYWLNDRIRVIRARIFNCTGPRKRNDVISDFGARVAGIVRRGGPLAVGNLATRRAILDVRDMVSALRLLAAKGNPGEAYNICAEEVYSIREIVELYESVIGRSIDCVVDPKLLRPSDEPVIFGSTQKLRADTGWHPTIPLRTTIHDVLDYEMRLLDLNG